MAANLITNLTEAIGGNLTEKTLLSNNTLLTVSDGEPTTTNFAAAAAPDQSQTLATSSSSLSNIISDQVSQTKLLASLVLFFITLLCGYLPVRMILNQNYIQYAMFAGGGVLMATAFCHLIPEAHDNYKLALLARDQTTNLANSHNKAVISSDISNNATQLLEHSHATDSTADGHLNVPYLEMTLCCGFFFMYLVEQLMVRFINTHTHEHPCDTSMGQLVVGSTYSQQQQTSETTQSQTVLVSSGGAQLNGSHQLNTADSTTGTHSVSGNSNTLTTSKSTEFYKFIRGLLIVSAFGAHSIFDGVAIGSQETVEKVWTIFLAISCHKLIIAAVVGLELYAATLESHLWTLVHLSIFSIMSPIGIILVVVAQESLHVDSNHPAMILLQSFATGTLLYIVFVEILQPKEDQAYDRNRFGKSISMIVGFAFMLMVLTLIGEGD